MPPLAVLVALADPTRCRIIEILRDGPQPVHLLAGAFDISRPAISRHLRVLKHAKLISETKAGRENRYALHANRLKPVRDWLDAFAVASRAKPTRARAVIHLVAEPAVVQVATAAPSSIRRTSAKAVAQMGFDF